MSNQDYDKQIEVLNSILWEYRALRPRTSEQTKNESMHCIYYQD